ncbi:MAG: tRNA (adenosine(37)-N6)-threonylcarbamoyltransferase complex dimerization subunit type 1 TsaB [Chloroflexota bacterium]|nr:MAG: tRNA (adenosine(37)-N6)-threonylcarbamoyltransferase complex dimerization subunit type 1 TsaB [Chloroflexota bacterium]HDD62049.1 tRNA (adenosine(37)-N6)-threonylcarbamoyltransferase complex dimerization subunit type 1 TsaB [Chloroflexota bacterium]
MLLGIDTSTQSVGIAIYDGHQILCEESWISRRYHTVELASAVDANLKRAGLNPKDLDVLAVATGPGSFTGLRIGMALVKGLAYTHQLPVIGIPTLNITARAVPPSEKRLAAVLQAGRTRLAVGWYITENDRWISEDLIENLSLEELLGKIDQPCILTGELTKEIREVTADHDLLTIVDPTLAMRSPKYLAELAWERWQAGDLDDVLTLKPYYLHKGDPIPG